MRRLLLLTLLACAACSSPAPKDSAAPAPEIAWRGWSEEAFAEAQARGKLVLLDLGAVWCHWCHVMDEETYSDPKVRELLASHYVAIKVDQDTDPNLSGRYYNYGWPATILFDAQGKELARLSGYIPKARFAGLLQAFVDDPTPGPSVFDPPRPAPASSAALPAELRGELEARLVDAYDPKHKGWGTIQKWMDWSCVEVSLEYDWRFGDEEARRRARETLTAQRGLIDPVWGGVYQYSHGGVWDNPHYEKLTTFQAHNLRVFSRAVAAFPEDAEANRAAAASILKYIREVLSHPEGGYHTSQDADLVKGVHSEGYFALDDAGRRAQGIPAVDTSRFTRENGLVIEALVVAAAALEDAEALAEAEAAGRWLLSARRREDGGFQHGPEDPGGPYLEDNLCAIRGFIALADATGDETWLEAAFAAGAFARARFRGAEGWTHIPADAASATEVPVTLRALNGEAARVFLALAARAPEEQRADWTQAAEHALRYLFAPARARQQRTALTLLADLDARFEAPHITILSRPGDARAAALARAAQLLPTRNRVIVIAETLERALAEGIPAQTFFDEPEAPPVAFFCVGQRCSVPVMEAEELRAAYIRFVAKR